MAKAVAEVEAAAEGEAAHEAAPLSIDLGFKSEGKWRLVRLGHGVEDGGRRSPAFGA